MLQQDWIMRQIQQLVQFVSRMIFGRDHVEYEIADKTHMSQTDLLYKAVQALLSERDICAAEDLLFAEAEEDSPEFLKLCLDFYRTINLLPDQELEDRNFSRQEIQEGLTEILLRCGISFPPV